MKRKWKKLSVAVVGFAVLATPFAGNVLNVISHANSPYYSLDSTQYAKQLQDANTALQKASDTNSDSDITSAIDTIIALPFSETNPDDKSALVSKMGDYIKSIQDSSLQAKYASYLTDKAIKQVGNSLLQTDYDVADMTVKSLPQSDVRTAYATKLAGIRSTMDKNLMNQIFHPQQNHPTESVGTPPLDFTELPASAFAPYKNSNTGDYLPGYGPSADGKNPNQDTQGTAQNQNATPQPQLTPAQDQGTANLSGILPIEHYTVSTTYVKENSTCYKVTTKTIAGKTPTVTKEVASKLDAKVFCSVDFTKPHGGMGYDFNQAKPVAPVKVPTGSFGGFAHNANSITNSAYDMSINHPHSNARAWNNPSNVWNTNPTPYTSTGQNKAPKPATTLHFTLDRTDKQPYYFDTDLKVASDGTVSYQEVHDVLFQLAIRSGGRAVDDKDRFEILLENKIVVINHTKDKMSVSVFDDILKGFKAQVKPMLSTVGQTSGQ
ncbi:hypothetical protein PP175_27125 (plasmid) [Aneurinibacillus sp. Ricciae_BoGa-3]|uniref:hypothetical protein n=1 Tax=Aneurinibacillus sp. Ricciae_BoGa-3 TaxID=3022697 RepID=UPI00233FEACA|nr:hypothetical protein [Aneurinibacillus sp. Ricciae_BoGa-3]WCK57712.1 hypothetical protein PP175_27125 [Aneurinibacillus sp. Ricciae_BoGa-3]